MTLWSISRSPLMHGGDMTKTDPFTLSLLTNSEVLAVNQHSTKNRPLFDRDGLIAWVATEPASGDTYLALFNARDRVPLTQNNARQYAALVSADPTTQVKIDIDLRDGRKIFLVAEPVAECDSSTLVIWQSPRVILADGTEQELTSKTWTQADAQWDSATVKKDAAGKVISLTALAPAVIEYALPAGAARFVATANVDPKAPVPVRIFTVVGTAANEDTSPGLPISVNLTELMGSESEPYPRPLDWKRNRRIQERICPNRTISRSQPLSFVAKFRREVIFHVVSL